MKTKRIPRILALLAMPLVGAMFLVSGIGTAHADGSYGDYVDGVGSVTNDWGDNPEICNGCGTSSRDTDLVHMWQTVLFLEGYLPASEIRGSFGPITAAATKKWQADRGLQSDGRVGPKTWGRADDNLIWQSNKVREPAGPTYVTDRARRGSTYGYIYFTRVGARDVVGDGLYRFISAHRECVGSTHENTRTISVFPDRVVSIRTISRTFEPKARVTADC